MRPLILLTVRFLSSCDKAPPAPAPIAKPATPPSSSFAPSPSQTSTPISTAAPSGRLNNQVPTPRVAPIPTSIPPAAPTTTIPPISDTDFTNAIRQAISGDPTLSPAAQRIEVTVSEGIARLSGTLATEKEKDNLRTAVSRVPGIKSIDNRVLVKQ